MATILVIEDDLSIAELLQIVLAEAGYRVEARPNLASARLLLAMGGTDLVVADMGLPDGSGAAVSDELAALDIPLLLMTGHPLSMVALDAQCRPYLRKPFHISELLRRVAELLARRVAVPLPACA